MVFSLPKLGLPSGYKSISNRNLALAGVPLILRFSSVISK